MNHRAILATLAVLGTSACPTDHQPSVPLPAKPQANVPAAPARAVDPAATPVVADVKEVGPADATSTKGQGSCTPGGCAPGQCGGAPTSTGTKTVSTATAPASPAGK